MNEFTVSHPLIRRIHKTLTEMTRNSMRFFGRTNPTAFRVIIRSNTARREHELRIKFTNTQKALRFFVGFDQGDTLTDYIRCEKQSHTKNVVRNIHRIWGTVETLSMANDDLLKMRIRDLFSWGIIAQDRTNAITRGIGVAFGDRSSKDDPELTLYFGEIMQVERSQISDNLIITLDDESRHVLDPSVVNTFGIRPGKYLVSNSFGNSALISKENLCHHLEVRPQPTRKEVAYGY